MDAVVVKRAPPVFLTASVQAVQSLQKGADLGEVLKFVNIAAPAAMAHLRRIQGDQIRQPVIRAMQKQLAQLGKVIDQLNKQMQERQKQAQEQNQKAQAMQSDQSLKAAKTFGDLSLRSQKQKELLRQKKEAHAQSLALADARVAREMNRSL